MVTYPNQTYFLLYWLYIVASEGSATVSSFGFLTSPPQTINTIFNISLQTDVPLCDEVTFFSKGSNLNWHEHDHDQKLDGTTGDGLPRVLMSYIGLGVLL